jgi:redox-sensitive bicupin YhaK (pirin superfamily)
MSETPAAATPAPFTLVVHARPRDLGDGFFVGRVLPSARRRMVGPFIFFDHMGPTEMAPGGGLDVRPHPHIGLATVTYLFDGEIFHRDSVGSAQAIRPGDVNWMVAGRGIVHSERTSPELRASGQRIHGIQAWVAMPEAVEEAEPSFFHHPAATLPTLEAKGSRLRVIAGQLLGQQSPVSVSSPTLYADLQLDAAASFELPPEHEECAFYVAIGEVECEGTTFGERAMVVLPAQRSVTLTATRDARVMLLGGAAFPERHIDWNFVSSSRARIEQARADWKARRFPLVPGDDVEFVPLPE